MKLSEATPGYVGCVSSVAGNHHLLSRLIGIGIVEGSTIQVIQNKKDNRFYSIAETPSFH